MNDSKIYLDYAATTPLRPGVLEAVTAVLSQPGNASSTHSFGRTVRARVEKARAQVADLAGTAPQQVIFTSGATEANNMVINAFRGERILISAIEHASIFEATPDAEKIPVARNGIIDIEAFSAMMETGPAPALIAVMMVNNETGVIQPVRDIVKIAKKKNPHVHVLCDAVAAAGKIPLDFQAHGFDYMTLAAHKIGGPQGVGALIAAPGARPTKMIFGAAQESRQRAGTENTPGIVGFGIAAEQTAQDALKGHAHLRLLRDRLESGVRALTPDLAILGAEAPRVDTLSALLLDGTPSQTLLMALDLEGIAVSGGTACASGSAKPSRIAMAMGYTEDQARGLIRVSMGWTTQESDIDHFIAAWSKITKRAKDKIHA